MTVTSPLAPPATPLTPPEQIADFLDANARLAFRREGVLAGIRRALNLHEGTNVTLTVTDDPTREEVDITITVAGAPPTGSAGGALDGTYPNPGLAASVAGAGLAETSDVLSVNAGTGLEISSDTVRIAAAAAGSGLTGGAGSALAVGDGCGTLVNADSVDVDLGMVDTTPAVDQTIPADYAAYVPGGMPYEIASGQSLTIESGGVLDLGTPDAFVNADAVSTVCSAGSTSSTSYVDVPGTSITLYFQKIRTDSRLLIFGGLSVFYDSTANFSGANLGVNIAGTDYTIDSFVESGANLRGAMYGSTPVSGLSAGLYQITLRVRIANGTLNFDAFGRGSISVTEVR